MNFDEKCIKYFLYIFRFQLLILLQAREVLNFERHPSVVCISSPEPNIFVITCRERGKCMKERNQVIESKH